MAQPSFKKSLPTRLQPSHPAAGRAARAVFQSFSQPVMLNPFLQEEKYERDSSSE